MDQESANVAGEGRYRPELGALLLVAFALRLAWGLMQPAVVDSRLPDQAEYLELGRNLLHRHELVFYDPRFEQDVRAYRTPAYPALIALCGGSVRAVRVVQALIDTSTVLAAYLLARRWLRRPLAIFAGALVALNPFMVYFSGLILSETLFTAMLAWGLVLLVRARGYAWGGAVLALSILVRPSAALLPVGLGCLTRLVLPTDTRGPVRWWRSVPVGLGMILLTAAAIVPWALRNHQVLGSWVWLTTNGGITEYDGFNPEATGASDQKFVGYPEFAWFGGVGEVQRDRLFAQMARTYIQEQWRRDPSHLFRLAAMKAARTWSPMPLSSEFGQRRLYVAAALAFALPFDLLVLAGLWRGKLPVGVRVLLLAPALYYTLVHAVSVGSLRYRIPVEPILAVLAAAGVGVIMEWVRRPDYRREAP